MNRMDELDNLHRLFDTKKEKLLKKEKEDKEKKEKTNELIAETYIELIKKGIEEAEKLNEVYNIKLGETNIGEYIDLSSIKGFGCTMINDGIKISFHLTMMANSIIKDKYSQYYDNKRINQILNDLGINVSFNDYQIIIHFVRENVPINIHNEPASQVKQGSPRTKKP